MPHRSLVLALVGPTASGKTKIAIDIARAIGGEIVCMDSTTVYQEFNIGSSKPTKEEQAAAPHHLIDILAPEDPFSAGHFVEKAEACLADILSRGKTPIVTGGTYFYLRALQHGMYPTPVIPAEVIDGIEAEFFDDEGTNTTKMYEELKGKDPAAAEKIHPNDKYRLLRALAVLRTTGELPSKLRPVPLSEAQSGRLWLKYSVALSRHALNQNIVHRTETMILGGLAKETESIRAKWPRARALQSVGYAETCQFLDKKLTEKQLRNEIIEKTRQLAKRQVTWVRSDAELRFIDSRDLPRVEKEVDNLRHVLGSPA
jgi:tRNA dimethylallyltransferase